MKITNGIIPDIALQLGHLSLDEHELAGCDHLADTKTLNASRESLIKQRISASQ
jgi:hypothetical protein